MAEKIEKNINKKTLSDTEDNRGSYREKQNKSRDGKDNYGVGYEYSEGDGYKSGDADVGGGTPGEKGGRGSMKGKIDYVAESPDDPTYQRLKEEGKTVRVTQPRNEDGTFTYNSTNNKKLSTEYSRGKTTPPFLEGINLKWLKKGTVIKVRSNRYIVLAGDMTPEELSAACKKYLGDDRGFAGLIGLEYENMGIGKRGRVSHQMRKTKPGEVVGQMDLSKMSQSMLDKMDKAAETFEKLKKEGFIGQQMAFENRIPEFVANEGTSTSSATLQTGESPTGPYPKINAAEVKANPKEFIYKNMSSIKEIQSLLPQGVKAGAIAQLFANGKFDSFESLKQELINRKNKTSSNA